MAVWKGGRGVKAPYESTHVRVPVPIKDKVQKIIDEFKEGKLDEENQFPTVENAIEIARSILTKKKSARVSMENLLTSIYGDTIKL